MRTRPVAQGAYGAVWAALETGALVRIDPAA